MACLRPGSPGQSEQHGKIPVSETTQTWVLSMSFHLSSNWASLSFRTQEPPWCEDTYVKADSHQEKVGQEWLAIQSTTLSEAGRLDLSNTKKMLNIHAWKQLINVLFPSVHFLLWCSRIKYCTVKPSSPHKNTMQGRNTGFPCSPGEVIFKGSRNRVGW